MSINRAAVSSALADLCATRPAAAIPPSPFGDSCTTRGQGARPLRHSCESRNPGRSFEGGLDSRLRGNDGGGWLGGCQAAASSDRHATPPIPHSCAGRNPGRPFEGRLDSRLRGNDGGGWLAAAKPSSPFGDFCTARARPLRHSCESRNLKRSFEGGLDSRLRGNDGQVWPVACQAAASFPLGDFCTTRARPHRHSCESRNLRRPFEVALDSRFRGNDGSGWLGAAKPSSTFGDFCTTRGQGARPFRHSCESRNLRHSFEGRLDSRFRGNDGGGWQAAPKPSSPLRGKTEMGVSLSRTIIGLIVPIPTFPRRRGKGLLAATQSSTGRTAWI